MDAAAIKARMELLRKEAAAEANAPEAPTPTPAKPKAPAGAPVVAKPASKAAPKPVIPAAPPAAPVPAAPKPVAPQVKAAPPAPTTAPSLAAPKLEVALEVAPPVASQTIPFDAESLNRFNTRKYAEFAPKSSDDLGFNLMLEEAKRRSAHASQGSPTTGPDANDQTWEARQRARHLEELTAKYAGGDLNAYLARVDKAYPGVNARTQLMKTLKIDERDVPAKIGDTIPLVMAPLTLATTGTLPAFDKSGTVDPSYYTAEAKLAREAKAAPLAEKVNAFEVGTRELGKLNVGQAGGSAPNTVEATASADAANAAHQIMRVLAEEGGEDTLFKSVETLGANGDWLKAQREIAARMLPKVQKRYPELSIDAARHKANMVALQYLAALRTTGSWTGPIYVSKAALEGGEFKRQYVPTPGLDVEVVGVGAQGNIILRAVPFAASLMQGVFGEIESASIGAAKFADKLTDIESERGTNMLKRAASGRHMAGPVLSFMDEDRRQRELGTDPVLDERKDALSLKNEVAAAMAEQAALPTEAGRYAERHQLGPWETLGLTGLSIIGSTIIPGPGEVAAAAHLGLMGEKNAQSLGRVGELLKRTDSAAVDAAIDTLTSTPGIDNVLVGNVATELRTLSEGEAFARAGLEAVNAGDRAKALALLKRAEQSEQELRSAKSAITVDKLDEDGKVIGTETRPAGRGPMVMEAVDRMEGELTTRFLDEQGGVRSEADLAGVKALSDTGTANAMNRLAKIVNGRGVEPWSQDVNLSSAKRRMDAVKYSVRHGVADDLRHLDDAQRSIEATPLTEAERAANVGDNILRGVSASEEVTNALRSFDYMPFIRATDADVESLTRALYDHVASELGIGDNIADERFREFIKARDTVERNVLREIDVQRALDDAPGLIAASQRALLMKREIRTTAAALVSRIARRTGGKILTLGEAEALTQASPGLKLGVRDVEAPAKFDLKTGARSDGDRISRLVAFFNKYQVPKEERLSPGAAKLLAKATAFFRGDVKAARINLALIDTIARNWSDATGRPSSEWWRTRIADIRVADSRDVNVGDALRHQLEDELFELHANGAEGNSARIQDIKRAIADIERDGYESTRLHQDDKSAQPGMTVTQRREAAEAEFDARPMSERVAVAREYYAAEDAMHATAEYKALKQADDEKSAARNAYYTFVSNQSSVAAIDAELRALSSSPYDVRRPVHARRYDAEITARSTEEGARLHAESVSANRKYDAARQALKPFRNKLEALLPPNMYDSHLPGRNYVKQQDIIAEAALTNAAWLQEETARRATVEAETARNTKAEAETAHAPAPALVEPAIPPHSSTYTWGTPDAPLASAQNPRALSAHETSQLAAKDAAAVQVSRYLEGKPSNTRDTALNSATVETAIPTLMKDAAPAETALVPRSEYVDPETTELAKAGAQDEDWYENPHAEVEPPRLKDYAPYVDALSKNLDASAVHAAVAKFAEQRYAAARAELNQTMQRSKIQYKSAYKQANSVAMKRARSVHGFDYTDGFGGLTGPASRTYAEAYASVIAAELPVEEQAALARAQAKLARYQDLRYRGHPALEGYNVATRRLIADLEHAETVDARDRFVDKFAKSYENDPFRAALFEETTRVGANAADYAEALPEEVLGALPRAAIRETRSLLNHMTRGFSESADTTQRIAAYSDAKASVDAALKSLQNVTPTAGTPVDSIAVDMVIQAYKKVPVHNFAQYAAREAAVSLLRGGTVRAASRLSYLQSLMNDGPVEWYQRAGELDHNFILKPGTALAVTTEAPVARKKWLGLFAGDSRAPKGFIEFVEDNKAVITGLESRDPSTFIHEVGHLLRSDLSPRDMDALVTELRSKGIHVLHDNRGHFVPESAAKLVDEVDSAIAESLIEVETEVQVKPEPEIEASVSIKDEAAAAPERVEVEEIANEASSEATAQAPIKPESKPEIKAEAAPKGFTTPTPDEVRVLKDQLRTRDNAKLRVDKTRAEMAPFADEESRATDVYAALVKRLKSEEEKLATAEANVSPGTVASIEYADEAKKAADFAAVIKANDAKIANFRDKKVMFTKAQSKIVAKALIEARRNLRDAEAKMAAARAIIEANPVPAAPKASDAFTAAQKELAAKAKADAKVEVKVQPSTETQPDAKVEYPKIKFERTAMLADDKLRDVAARRKVIFKLTEEAEDLRAEMAEVPSELQNTTKFKNAQKKLVDLEAKLKLAESKVSEKAHARYAYTRAIGAYNDAVQAYEKAAKKARKSGDSTAFELSEIFERAAEVRDAHDVFLALPPTESRAAAAVGSLAAQAAAEAEAAAARVKAKAEAKAAAKAEAEAKAKPETKPETKAKAEPKTKVKPEPKPKATLAAIMDAQPSAPAKVAADVAAEIKPEIKAAPSIEVKPEVAVEVKPKAKPQVKSKRVSEAAVRREPEAYVAPEPKPAVRVEDTYVRDGLDSKNPAFDDGKVNVAIMNIKNKPPFDKLTGPQKGTFTPYLYAIIDLVGGKTATQALARKGLRDLHDAEAADVRAILVASTQAADAGMDQKAARQMAVHELKELVSKKLAGMGADELPAAGYTSPQTIRFYQGADDAAASGSTSGASQSKDMFYSGLERLVQNQLPVSFTSKKGGKSAAAQAMDAIRKSPLWTKHLAEEDKWIGLTEWLKSKEGQPSIDTAEVLGFVREQTPKVEIKKFGFTAGEARGMEETAQLAAKLGQGRLWAAASDSDILSEIHADLVRANAPRKVMRAFDLYAADVRRYETEVLSAIAKNPDDYPNVRDVSADYFHRAAGMIDQWLFLDDTTAAAQWADRHLPNGTKPFEILISPNQSKTFNNPHFPGETGTVHIRGQKRVVRGADGNDKTILELSEIQNDWAQSKRAQEEFHAILGRQGVSVDEYMNRPFADYSDRIPADVEKQLNIRMERFRAQSGLSDSAMETPLPEYPHKDAASWVRLGLKTAIRKAAEDGIDEIRLISGEDVKKIVGGDEGGQSYFYNEVIPNVMDGLGRELGAKVESAPSPEYIASLKRELEDLPTSDATAAEKAKKSLNLTQRIAKLEERRAALGATTTQTKTHVLEIEVPEKIEFDADSVVTMRDAQSTLQGAANFARWQDAIAQANGFSHSDVRASFQELRDYVKFSDDEIIARGINPEDTAYVDELVHALNSALNEVYENSLSKRVTRTNPLVIKLSPELMASVRKEGLPLFQDGKEAGLRGIHPEVRRAEEAYANMVESAFRGGSDDTSRVSENISAHLQSLGAALVKEGKDIEVPVSSEVERLMAPFMREERPTTGPFGRADDVTTSVENRLPVELTDEDLANSVATHEQIKEDIKRLKGLEVLDGVSYKEEIEALQTKRQLLLASPEHKAAVSAALQEKYDIIARKTTKNADDMKMMTKIRQKIASLAPPKDVPTPASTSANPAALPANLRTHAELNIPVTEKPLNLGTTNRAASTVEDTVHGEIYQSLAGSPKLTATFGFFLGIGADEDHAFRAMPPEARRITMSGVRPIQEYNADISRLVSEWARDPALEDSVFAYLNGEATKFGDDSHTPTSGGTNHTEWALQQIQARWNAFTVEDQMRLEAFAKSCGRNEEGLIRPFRIPEESVDVKRVTTLIDGILKRADGSDESAMPGDAFINLARQSIWHEGSVTDARSSPNVHAWFLSLLDAAGVFDDSVTNVMESNPSRRLVSALAAHTPDQIKAPHHAAVLLGTYGGMREVGDAFLSQGFGVGREDAALYSRWRQGLAIPAAAMPKVTEMAKKYGLEADFSVVPELDVGALLLPRETRNRLQQELLHGRRLLSAEEKLGLKYGADPKTVLSGEYKRGFVEGFVQRTIERVKNTMVFGNLFMRAPAYINDTQGLFEATGSVGGLAAASRMAARRASTLIFTNAPGFAQVADTMSLVSKVVSGPGSKVAKLMTKGRTALSKAADASINLFSALITFNSANRNNPRVVDILEGGNQMIETANGPMTRNQVRAILRQEGVFATFERGQMAEALFNEGSPSDNVAKKIYNRSSNAVRRHRYETNYAISVQTRVGNALAFMEMGYDPRTAGRLALMTSYDYVNTSSGWDKHVIYNMFFPFQSFRKNNSRFILNRLTSYNGTRKLAMATRLVGTFPQTMANFLEAIDRDEGDRYGVDEGSLSSEARTEFNKLTLFYEEGYVPLYGSNPDKWPDIVKSNLALGEDFTEYYNGLNAKEQEFLLYGYGGYENVPTSVKAYVNEYINGYQRSVMGGAMMERAVIEDSEHGSIDSYAPMELRASTTKQRFSDNSRFQYEYMLSRPNATIRPRPGAQVNEYVRGKDALRVRSSKGSGTDSLNAYTMNLAETNAASYASWLGCFATIGATAANTVVMGGDKIFDADPADIEAWHKGLNLGAEYEVESSRNSEFYGFEEFVATNKDMIDACSDPERAVLFGNFVRAAGGEDSVTTINPALYGLLDATSLPLPIKTEMIGGQERRTMSPYARAVMEITPGGTIFIEANDFANRTAPVVNALMGEPETMLSAQVMDARERGEVLSPAFILSAAKAAGFAVTEVAPSSVMYREDFQGTKKTDTPE